MECRNLPLPPVAMITRLAAVLEERRDFRSRRKLRSVFQHRQIIIDRLPVAAADRLTRRVSIDAPVRIHLRHLCFVVWPFLAIGKLYDVRFHIPAGLSAMIRRDFDKPGKII